MEKIKISYDECAIVLKKGIFKEILEAGNYGFPYTNMSTYSIQIIKMSGIVKDISAPLKILSEDTTFNKLAKNIKNEPGEMKLEYYNNKVIGFIFEPNVYFWDPYNEREFVTLDMNDDESIKTMQKEPKEQLVKTGYIAKFLVAKGEVGILYVDNNFDRKLLEGIYYFWTFEKDYKCEIVQVQISYVDMNGQEILTLDKVSVRINFFYAYRILEPKKILEDFQGFYGQLYNFVQMNVRDYIGKYRLDELLEKKKYMDKEILNELKKLETNYYVQFSEAGIKDVILPGEIRDIMNLVLVAEKQAQANVITRREEVASTRSLLNTAKLMEENKTLLYLKEMEYLEKVCGQIGEITVSGGEGLLKELSKIFTTGKK